MNNKKIIYLIILTLLVTVIGGCELNKENIDSDVKEESNHEVIEYTPEEGGEIILALTNFNTLNPLMTENNSYYYFSKLIYESLFDFDDDLNMKEQLVKDYSVSDNGRTIEIKLEDNILWHDGQPLTSDDVRFTVNTIKYANTDTAYNRMFSDALGSFSPSDIRRIVEVGIVDEKNLIITFDRSFNNNLEVLTFPIIPQHLFAKDGLNNKAYKNALELENYTPVGTGPFKFKNYEKLKEITLEANEGYWGKSPYIDRVLGKVFDNEEDIMRAFEIGEVNMATTIGVDWEKYNENNGVSSLEFISPNYDFLGFNFEKEIFQENPGKTLRKAIAYAIDRQAIIEGVYLGHGTQIDVPIHPNSWLLSDSANSYGYNLDVAKEEISKLNFKDTDEDGILEGEEGNNISINLLTNTLNPARLKTAEMIKEDLKKIGLDVNIFPKEESDDIKKEDIQRQWEEVNETLLSGEYDIVLLGWQLSVIPDLSFAFHSSQIDYDTNFIRYSNEEMDVLLEGVFLNGNREEKKKNYGKLQDLIVEDLPYLSLFFKNKSLLLNNNIMGDLQPTFFNPYRGIENAYIAKDLR